MLFFKNKAEQELRRSTGFPSGQGEVAGHHALRLGAPWHLSFMVLSFNFVYGVSGHTDLCSPAFIWGLKRAFVP